MSEKKRTRLFAERKCSFCGSDNHYAKGLCEPCYNRLRRTGTLEYKDRSGPRPQTWGENTKRIITLYKSGMSQSEIAREIGVTRQAVHIVIKRIEQIKIVEIKQK